MTDGNRRKKAQAVFFSLVMVLSMVGGSVALAGSAAAAAPAGGSLSDNTVQSDATVTIEGIEATSDANNLEIIALNQSEDEVGSTPISADDVSDSESWSTELNVGALGLAEGEYDIYLNDTDDGVTSEVGPLSVDDEEPLVTPVGPEDGEIINQVDPTIEFEVTDNQSAEVSSQNDDLELIVDLVSDTTSETYVIDPVDGANTDGLTYDTSDGTLTIEPGTGDIPELDEGSVDVDVTATDEAGNQNVSDSYGFEVNIGELDFDLTQVEDIDSTNDVNETFTVDVSSTGPALNDSESQLTITGLEYDLTLTEDNETAYTAGGQFAINPETDGDIPSFDEDGVYTVEYSAADEAGTSDSSSASFEVDTDSPNVTDLSLAFPDVVTTETNGEEVDVTFDEEVIADTVRVDIDSEETETPQTLDDTDLVDGQEPVSDTVTFNASTKLEAENLGEIEDTEAVVNVTTASDFARNGLGNADADVSNATFEVDNDGPTVALDPVETNGDGTVSGLTNFTDFISNPDDVDEVAAFVDVGQDSNSALDVTADADSVPTQNFPDGTHDFRVVVYDENGNIDTATQEFTLDNDQAFSIDKDRLAHTVEQNPELKPPTGEFEVQSAFVTDPGNVDQFYVNGEAVDDDYTVDAAEYRGDPVSITAENTTTGDEFTYYVEFSQFVGVESDDEGNVTVNVQTDEELEEGDALNVSVSSVDGHHDAVDLDFTREDLTFEEVDSDANIYTTQIDAPRDGDHQITVESSDVDVALDRSVFDSQQSTTVIVDSTLPELVSAELNVNYDAAADERTAEIEAKFDQPIDSDNGITFEGNANIIGVSSTGPGTLVLELDQEPQTGDAPLVNVSQPEAKYGSNTAPESGDFTTIGTSTDILELEDGVNVVSAPAVTGEVDASDFDEDGVEAVWAYDADAAEWSSYVPDADENELTALEGGQGYVVKADGAVDVGINAENLPSAGDGEVPQFRTEQDLVEGWNLIGHYQTVTQPQAEALDSISDSVHSVKFGYTTQTPSALETGQGYWVNMDEGDNYAPTDLNTVGPTVLDVSVSDEPATDGGEVTLTVQIEPDEAAIDRVTVTSNDLELQDELSEVERDTQGVTFEGTVATDYDEEFAGLDDASLDVTVTDTDNNMEFDSVRAETAVVIGNDFDIDLNGQTVEDDVTIAGDNNVLENGSIEGNVTIDGNDNTLEDLTVTGNIVDNGDGNTQTNVDAVANSPTGDVTINGDDASLTKVNADGTINVTGSGASVTNSSAKSVTVSGSQTSLNNVSASETVDITDEASETSLNKTKADGGLTVNDIGSLVDAVDNDYETYIEGTDEGYFGGTINVGTELSSSLDASSVRKQGTRDVTGGTYYRVALDESDINTDNNFTSEEGADAISGAYINSTSGQVEHLAITTNDDATFFFVPSRLEGEEIIFVAGNTDVASGGDYSELTGDDIVIGKITVGGS